MLKFIVCEDDAEELNIAVQTITKSMMKYADIEHKVEKFQRYNEKLEKNGWYVPGGSANVSTEPEKEPIVPDPVSPEEEPVAPGSDEYTDEEPIVSSSTVEPTDNTESTPSEIEIETQP